MKNAVLALITSACLAGCATVDQNTAFDGSSGGAFAVVVADNVPEWNNGSYTFVFSRVDMQTSTFQPEWFSIVFDAGVGTFVVHELKKPASVDTTLRFGGHAVTPGDYAYAARKDLQGSVVWEKCFSEGAPVFRIVAGKTNVIPLDDVRDVTGTDPMAALDKGAKVLAAYPKISAPLELAQQVGSIAFKTTKYLGQEVCRHRDVKDFTIVSKPT
jgi:uncharacterized protein YceK